jgi:hypothetical protein
MGESMDDLAALLFRERCFILDGLMTFSCERVADVVMLFVDWIDAPILRAVSKSSKLKVLPLFFTFLLTSPEVPSRR